MVELNKTRTLALSETRVDSKRETKNPQSRVFQPQKSENLTPQQNEQLMEAIKAGKIKEPGWGAYYSTMNLVPLVAQYSNGREIGLNEQFRNNQREAASLYNQAVKDGIINPNENTLGSTTGSTS